jgi:threonine synthase
VLSSAGSNDLTFSQKRISTKTIHPIETKNTMSLTATKSTVTHLECGIETKKTISPTATESTLTHLECGIETKKAISQTATKSTLTHLECGMCGKRFDADQLINMCDDCQRPLLARYDLAKAKETFTAESLKSRVPTLRRYEEVLPIRTNDKMLSLGEGWTMMHHAKRLGTEIGCPNTYVKDESGNATGSFKARGLSVAVSRAYELGAKELSIPSADNAAGAMSAYAAAAGLPSHVFMPKDVPKCFQTECQQLGASVTLVDGLINDCGKKAKEGVEKYDWFDVSTLKEPYRLEGKKTMGYEIAEQFNWTLPDVIVYPTGGGTGLVGMWKAFDELETMGMIGSKRPRMVSVQSSGCAPIVRAFDEGTKHATMWEGAKTIADGLRVPVAAGDHLILQALRDSGGTAVAVDDADMIKYTLIMGRNTGIFPAPEGAACLAAQVHLLKKGWIQPDEIVVIFNTGTGLKYHHLHE